MLNYHTEYRAHGVKSTKDDDRDKRNTINIVFIIKNVIKIKGIRVYKNKHYMR